MARQQPQAIQGAVMVYLPSMLLSGFLYPFSNMPVPAQIAGWIFPLTHYIRVCRAVLIRGASSAEVLNLAWPLALQATIFLALALTIFRRKL